MVVAHFSQEGHTVSLSTSCMGYFISLKGEACMIKSTESITCRDQHLIDGRALVPFSTSAPTFFALQLSLSEYFTMASDGASNSTNLYSRKLVERESSL